MGLSGPVRFCWEFVAVVVAAAVVVVVVVVVVAVVAVVVAVGCFVALWGLGPRVLNVRV